MGKVLKKASVTEQQLLVMVINITGVKYSFQC